MAQATGSKAMLASETRRRSFFGTLVDLYKSDLAFRGMTDFAIIGGLVMMFIHPPQSIKLPWSGAGAGSGTTQGGSSANLLGGFTGQQGSGGATSGSGGGSVKQAAATIGGTSGPVVAIPFAESLKNPRLGIGFLFDVDPTPFERSKPADRPRLAAARSAVMLRKPDDILEALREADGDDPNVALLRGAAFAIRNTEASNKSAEVLWRKAVAGGNVQAKALLGRLLISGRPGIEQNVDAGRALVEEAAASGDPQALRFAGIGYLSGDFGTLNPIQAAELLKKGADAGDAMAMGVYARLLAEGIGMPSADGQLAETYLKKAADAGLTAAQHTLGDWYIAQYTEGMRADLKDAVTWHTRAYEKGRSVSALIQLAYLYATVGKTPPWNDSKIGFDYVRKCSGFNHSACQNNAGVGWNGGHFGPRNAALARAHLAIAANLGYAAAKTQLVKLDAELSSEQKAKAAAYEKELTDSLKPVPAEIPLQYAGVTLPPPVEAIALDGSKAARDESIAESPDYAGCVDNKADPKSRIEACGRLITAGRGRPEELALAYFGRGYANRRSDKSDEAVADYTEAIKLDPKNKTALNNRGSIYLEKRTFDKALADYEAALAIDPDYVKPLAGKAELFRLQKRLDEAAAAIKVALAKDAEDGWAKTVRQRIEADQKALADAAQKSSTSQTNTPNETQSVAATEAYKLCDDSKAKMAERFAACGRVIDAGKGTPEELSTAWFGRGAALGAESKKDEALKAYTEALKHNPRSLPSLHNRALIQIKLGDLDKALADLDAAKAIDPKHKYVLANRADVLRRKGQLTEALDEVRAALDVDSTFDWAVQVRQSVEGELKRRDNAGSAEQALVKEKPPENRSKNQDDPEIEAIRTRAGNHLQRNDYDSAIADFTDIIRREKGTADDFTNRGVAYHKKGDYDQAFNDYSRAVSKAGHNGWPHYNRAIIYSKRRELDKAIADVDAAIDQHGLRTTKILADRASLLVETKQFAKALKDHDAILDMLDSNKDGKEAVARAYVNRGLVHQEAALAEISRCHTLIPPPKSCEGPASFVTTLLDFEAARAIDPGNAEAHFRVGWIADRLKNVDLAIENYTKAVKADPNMSVAYNNRGVLFGNKRQWELAIADYTDAIRADPKNKHAWANRGVLFANQRKRNRAIPDLEESLKIDPDYEYAKSALRRLGIRR